MMIARKNLVLFLLVFLTTGGIAVSADIPVLLRLSRADQADTNGCNFVEQITAVLYREILEGKVKLWDSPAKEIQITGITLQELEKSTNTQFINEDIIYIYELWSNNRKMLTSETLGFNFSNKSSTGEDVAYGFVEYLAVRDLFLRTRINTNVNGDYSSTFAAYINNKSYNYNIIQFNGRVIKDVIESNKIKHDFVGTLRFNPETFVFNDPDKYVSYFVENNPSAKDEKSLNSNKLLSSIEQYLTENQEVFYNYGGDKILSYFQKNQLKVTRIEVSELWKKVNDSLRTEPRYITIFVNDSALVPMSYKELNKLDIKVGKQNLADFINVKQYNMVITQINSEKVSRKDSFLFYKALISTDWRRLSEYVKNF